MSTESTLPMANVAAEKASRNYLAKLLDTMDHQILQAIEDGKYQVLINELLDPTFDDFERPYLEAKLRSHYGSLRYLISEILTGAHRDKCGYLTYGRRALTCRISWFPTTNI